MPTKPLLDLQFHDPIFSIASHPSEPYLAVGLANGSVYMLKYDINTLRAINDRSWKVKVTKSGYEGDAVQIVWKTKRHKGSVRSLCFDETGATMFSIGGDKVLKKSDSMTGKVLKKTTLDNKSAFTKVLKSQTHTFVVLGDEAGNLTVLNSDTLEVTNCVKSAHEDSINAIIQQTPTKFPYRFIAVGSTTLSLFDLRKKEVMSISDNQEDEILSTCLADPSAPESTIVCGMSEGILTTWSSKNGLRDQLNRIKIAKDESIDCIISAFGEGEIVWCGCSNGMIYKIDVKRGKILETRVHSKLDEVAYMDIDSEFRVISGGMDSVRLWDGETEEDEEDEDEQENEDSSDDESDGPEEFKGFDDDSDMEFLDEAISEKNATEKALASKKRPLDEPKEKEEEELKLSKKNRRKLEKRQKNVAKHEHGIKRFDDL